MIINIRTGKNRFAAAVAAVALAGTAVAAVALADAGSAAAATHPDLKITQVISGSTKSGHTFDTLIIKNNGSAGASHVNVNLYTNTNGPFGDFFSGKSWTCEVMPAPPPYNYGTSCQVAGSIGAGKTASIKGDFSGTVGAAFTNVATVGEFQGDANLKDNSNTVSSWFGPRADLAVGGTAKTGTKSGHATTVTRVFNRGPNNANNLQETIEFKNVTGAHATGNGGSCQVIDPAAGYDFAASCVRNSLATRHRWTLTLDLEGTSGARVTAVTKVSSLTTDPKTTNNKMTRRVTLK
jgi:hypothetical protein